MKLHKLVWAIDALEEQDGPLAHASAFVRGLPAEWDAVLHPVHVLHSSELSLTDELAGPWISQYRPTAEAALRRLVERLGLECLAEPVVLDHPSALLTGAVDALIEHAQSIGADAILVSSHGRSGVSRLLLGSFAETLLLRSPVPIIVAGARMRPQMGFTTIVFPTDFAEDAKPVFRRVIGIAREWGARVVLYHSTPLPMEPVYREGFFLAGSPWIPIQESYDRERGRDERHVHAWAEWAKHQGVEVETILDTDSRNVAESIVELAREREAGWIIMAAHSGALSSALLGSVTRKVARAADCPVWVMRIGAEKARAERGDRRLSA